MSLAQETISSLRKKLSAREVTSEEIVRDLLQRIEKTEPKIKGYLRWNADDALKQAKEADLTKPLGGVPIAIKDNINTKGDGCTCSSKILEGYVAPYDATVIAKLREAGAVLLGRTNLDEFAMGSSTENSAIVTTRNPWDTERIPGGSSGGSAAVVAARSAIAALGSDTGGSIRQPASLCGIVGLKPTYGRVSRFGLIAFASSLDQIGPMTRTVEDAALVLQTIAGPDPRENTSRNLPVPDYLSQMHQPLKGLRVGVPKEYFVSGMDKEIEKTVRDAIDWYAKNGAEVIDVSLPNAEAAIAVYYIIATAEASANLARFDGVRYGRRAKDVSDAIDLHAKTRAEGFGPEVKRRIILGTYVLSSGYYDAYYNRAQKVRRLMRQDFTEAFKKCDVLLTPTSPIPAFKVGEKTQSPVEMYLADIFTTSANLTEVCAISVPCGFSSGGLPVGLQLMGPHFEEGKLLRAAWNYEQAHEWHKQEPKV